jgi:hypothetical protein
VSSQAEALQNLLDLISEALAAGQTYKEIGELFGVSGALIWKLFNRGIEPKKFEIRQRLGLPNVSEVLGIDRPITPGSLALGSKNCSSCTRPFIPNDAKRDKCYLCSPYRKNSERAYVINQKTGGTK